MEAPCRIPVSSWDCGRRCTLPLGAKQVMLQPVVTPASPGCGLEAHRLRSIKDENRLPGQRAVTSSTMTLSPNVLPQTICCSCKDAGRIQLERPAGVAPSATFRKPGGARTTDGAGGEARLRRAGRAPRSRAGPGCAGAVHPGQLPAAAAPLARRRHQHVSRPALPCPALACPPLPCPAATPLAACSGPPATLCLAGSPVFLALRRVSCA